MNVKEVFNFIAIFNKCVIAACKDSYVVYACWFDRVGKWEWFAESMRINENHYKYSHLCHLVLDHWRGKTLFLCDSHWFLVILSDSQWFLNKSENILGDSQWFSVILSDSQISLKLIPIDFQQFSVILSDSWWFSNKSEIHSLWFSVILGDSQWFLMILNDSQINLKLILSDSWWFLVILK